MRILISQQRIRRELSAETYALFGYQHLLLSRKQELEAVCVGSREVVACKALVADEAQPRIQAQRTNIRGLRLQDNLRRGKPSARVVEVPLTAAAHLVSAVVRHCAQCTPYELRAYKCAGSAGGSLCWGCRDAGAPMRYLRYGVSTTSMAT